MTNIWHLFLRIAGFIIIVLRLFYFNELNVGYSYFVSNDDQVFSITPKTQAEVDIVKNVSSQYEVKNPNKHQQPYVILLDYIM